MLNERLQQYLHGLIPDRLELFRKIEEYAKENNVPIMELAGIESMLQILRIQNPAKILEIGTAIGYSALRMANELPNCEIITIERDPERYILAEKFIKEANRESQISLIKGDALEVGNIVEDNGPYDCIFIDAAKGQYKRFFELYAPYLTDNGMIITDNVLFKGLVYEENIKNKRVRNLVKKINEFNRWLLNHSLYDTVILPVGDGVAISRKR